MPIAIIATPTGALPTLANTFFAIIEEGIIAEYPSSVPEYDYPEVVLPGELLIAIFGSDGDNRVITWNTTEDESPDNDGWIVLEDSGSQDGNNQSTMSLAYKIAKGDESGQHFTVVISASEESVCAVYAVSRWDRLWTWQDSQASPTPPAGQYTWGSSSGVHPAPDLVLPSNRYQFITAIVNDVGATSGTYPASYTENRLELAGGSTFGARLRTATKALAAAGDTPEDWGTSNSRASETTTLAISPAADQVETINLDIVNPGAETGDTTGWTNETGAIAVRSASPDPNEGSFYFTGGVVALSEAYQDVPFPSSWLTDIDAGRVACKLIWAQNSFAGADDGRMGIEFLDDSSPDTDRQSFGFIRYATNIAPTEWTQRTIRHRVPPGARYVRMRMRMERDSGTNNDCYIDSITGVLQKAVVTGGERLPDNTTEAEPDSISGLVAWFDASDINTLDVTSGDDLVRRWDDKSPNSPSLYVEQNQLSPEIRPQWMPAAVNGLDSIQFFSAEFLEMPGSEPSLMLDEHTVLLVHAPDNVGGNHWAAGMPHNNTGAAPDAGWGVGSVGGTIPYQDINLDGTERTLTDRGSYTAATVNLTVSIWSPPNHRGIGVNKIFFSPIFNVGGNIQYGTSPRFAIGCRNPDAPDQFYDGLICEVVVYDRLLDFDELQQVSNYLCHKWGISLASVWPGEAG